MSGLSYKRTNVYEKADTATKQAIFDYAKGYCQFIDAGKTEREACKINQEMAEANGYKPYAFGQKLQAGDKV